AARSDVHGQSWRASAGVRDAVERDSAAVSEHAGNARSDGNQCADRDGVESVCWTRIVTERFVDHRGAVARSLPAVSGGHGERIDGRDRAEPDERKLLLREPERAAAETLFGRDDADGQLCFLAADREDRVFE